MRPSRNVHLGLALGVVTAGVILALGGCVTHGTSASSTTAPATSSPAASSPASAKHFEAFSDSERERILAVQDIVERAAAEHELDPTLINAMIWVESRFEPRAKSPAGARGLMQLMPATAAYLAKRMGEHNARAYDPEFNVRAGSLYLAEMMKKFGDESHAVAAYHAGPGNVKRWLESGEAFPDYSQTYVAKVMDARARFEGTPLHGRPSKSATPIVESQVDAKLEPLEVPDVDTLPDAADIHGVPRVIYERPEPAPVSEPPEPISEPTPVSEQEYEPVFVVHPELDRDRDAAPQGWPSPDASEPKPEPKPEPEPEPKPEPPQDDVETGLGVLPDL